MARWPVTNTIPVPTRGANVAQVEPYIPTEFIWKSQNMLARFGELRTRPGFNRVLPVGPGERILGGAFFTPANGVTQTVAAGPTRLFQLGSSAWLDITGGVLTGSADDQVRFTVFPSGGANFLIETNNHDVPRKWDGVAGTFVPLGGAPPIGRDITACFSRVLLFNVVEAGVRSTSRVRISDFNDPDSWPAGLVFDTTDTNDDGVAIRNLNRTTCLLYKDSSIWIATGQAGTFPFQIEVLAAEQPGPLGPSCVVSARGSHFYLANDYRIYMVSSLGPTPLSGAVDKELQARVRLLNKSRAWGVYRRIDQTVWFFFPSPASADPDQAVSLDIQTGAIHFHQFPLAMTSGWQGDSISAITWNPGLLPYLWNAGGPSDVANTFPTWLSFGGTLVPTEFLGSSAGQVYRYLYDVSDDGTAIVMVWEIPPRSWDGPKKYLDFDAIESSFEKHGGGSPVLVDIGVSEAIDEAIGPTYTNVGQHNTQITTRQLLAYANEIALRGRFMNARYRCTSIVPVVWKGAVAYVQSEDAP